MKTFSYIFLLNSFIILLFSTSVFAKKDKKEEEEVEKPIAGRYAPEGCDFEITFPSEPYKTKRCPVGDTKCYDLHSYTMVYDHMTTVDISVACSPSTPEQYDRYNEAVIGAALKGMLSRVELSDYRIDVDDRGDIRQGMLIGEGTRGRQGTLYNAQLWVGKNSIMTVEANLVGDTHPEADVAFGDILNSIGTKEGKKADTALEKVLNDAQTQTEVVPAPNEDKKQP